ncbi:Dyp-type peroxidase [Nocardioides sp. J54]|uniref:Dyp-type peroxidase n=1 Tax=Nocardioides sp. J54 TaxID=935866 RepID=UPI0004B1C8F4|nr:Dyp-type peroxidase [Nocardioides sp. J54]
MSPDRRPHDAGTQRTEPDRTRGTVSRRRLLGATAVTGGAAAAGWFGARGLADPRSREPGSGVVPFAGAHQAGIDTPPQRCAMFVAADLTVPDAGGLRRLLQDLSATIARITRGEDPPDSPLFPDGAEVPTDYATGLPPERLTVTVGLGPDVFALPGTAPAPRRLRPLPEFAGDALDPRWCGGDLLLQLCADDAQVVSWAYRSLRARLPGQARVRWTQSGFLSAPPDGGTPRNMFGHKDGTANPRPGTTEFDATVWALDDEPDWFADGTYLAFRKIRMRTAEWDLSPRSAQDEVIGRRRSDGAPLTGRREHDEPDYGALADDGQPVIPVDAHIRRVRGAPMYRRGYSYDYGQLIASAGGRPDPTAPADDGHDHAPGTPEHDHGGHGDLDAGLLFCAYGNDPDNQFVAAQLRSAESDRLNAFVQHTGSGLYAILPGCRDGGYLGESLLG